MKRIAIFALVLIVALGALAGCSKAPALERGTWNDDVYTNTFSGVTYTLLEGWVAATDEEIKSVMNTGAEAAGIDESTMDIANLKVVYDAFVADQLTGTNIIFSFENLKLSIGGTGMDEKEYVEAVKSQLVSVGDISYTTGDEYEKDVCGEQWYVLETKPDTGNMEQYYLVRRVGNYMASIIITLVGEGETLDSVLAQFG